MRHPLLLCIALLPLLAIASGIRITQMRRIHLINAHNEARSDVSPAASNMLFMVWNVTLENLAQQWAERCTFEYGQPDEAFEGKLGQNLFAGIKGYYIPGISVKAWEKEKANYTYATLGCVDGEICEHYTQVVSAKSTQVGCGVHYCQNMLNYTEHFLVVCNYFTPGNEKNEAPYENGTACSACPEDYTGGCKKNLCRQTPKCGGLTCESGTMNTATCLCNCGFDRKNTMGPFCAVYNTGVRPCVRPYTLLLTAALGALLYSNL